MAIYSQPKKEKKKRKKRLLSVRLPNVPKNCDCKDTFFIHPSIHASIHGYGQTEVKQKFLNIG
jgi:hypothetical protein